jgi:glycosyltransferase involved in cell wall biosynthesis
MQPPEVDTQRCDGLDYPLARLMAELLEPSWYRKRYTDVGGNDLSALQHFIHFGAAEKRDPNRFFDTEWYVEHNPDVASSGLNPLQHYLQAGAAELRNPHPRFDAVYYVQQYPDAAVNPLLYHLRVGMARGYPTEKPIDIRDYLPSDKPTLPAPSDVSVDVVIPVHRGFETATRCIRSVLADRAWPLARIIVIDDRCSEPRLVAWLESLAEDGEIHLIRNRRYLGFSASAQLAIDAAEEHDVVLLRSNTEVPAMWLRRLVAQAYAHPDIATVSPLWDRAAISGYPDDDGKSTETSTRIDDFCHTTNAGRFIDVSASADHCAYIRQAALRAVGGWSASDFCARATDAGWQHRVVCDTFVSRNGYLGPKEALCPVVADAIAFQFAVTASLFRESGLPVILMVTHSAGGGVRRHINGLIERYRDSARFLLLQGTERGTALWVPSLPDHPVLRLPADRLNDLLTVLRSTNLSRIHIHHLLRMDMDIRALVHRLGVPFDVTVHDYYAICPQVNLLRGDDGLYCGEPGPAACNACIADQSSHGARDIISWRRDLAWQFIDADRVICPSENVKRRLGRYGLAERAFVVPHEQQTQTIWNTRLPAFSMPPLRIALLGVLANHKGARAVAEVAEAAAPGTVQIHLIGHLEDRFPKPARKLIKATGRYRDSELPALLRRIDPHVIWLPSSAPETYSYTLSAAIATGLPIVATDIGSFTERLAGRPYTWLVDHRTSAKDWLAVFDAVQATLRRPADRTPAQRPVTISDFYNNRYLSPARPGATVSGGSSKIPPRTKTRDKNPVGRKPRITVVPERNGTGGLTPSAYIRLLLPLDHPTVGDGFDIVLADAETVFDYDADIIVTQRYAVRDLETANRLAVHAHRIGARLLFDLDDDLLSVPTNHPDATTLRPFAKVVRRMLTVADTVWVSTSGLAERLASIRPDALVVENRLDERIWIHEPTANSAWDDPIRILCMGTTTHDRDFALIEPVLARLKAEYRDHVMIDVLGMTIQSELPTGLNRIGPSTHASRSYAGFVNWLTSMQIRWHIGLAPLLDTSFNRCKSPIKAMDYAALGLVTVASDMPTYRGSLADGRAGQLVSNDPMAWHATLDWLIRDHTLRRSIAQQARRAFVEDGTLHSDGERRRAAWTSLLRAKKPRAA